MTPLHNMVIQQLLPVCLDATKKSRELTEKLSQDRENTVRHREIIGLRNELANRTDTTTSSLISKLIFLATGNTSMVAPLTNSVEMLIHLEPFCVFHWDHHSGSSEEGFYICSNGKKHSPLDRTGMLNSYTFSGVQKGLRIATDEEVEQCLYELNEAQLKTIVVDPLFHPIMSGLFTEQRKEVDLEAADPKDIPNA